MPNTILIKRSGTVSAVPSSLSYGELALNYADGRLFYKNSAGSIVPLTANSGLNAKLDALTFNGSTTTFNLTSSSAAVTPANANCLLISLNGVLQEPGVAFTVSGSQITFAAAPASTDTFFGVHLTGGAIGGGGSSGDAVISSPAQITSDQNNYALPSGADIVRLSTDATRTITGFEADTGAVVTLFNVGSFDIRIDHEDTASTAANRVTSATGADIVLAPNDNITLVYDSTSARWRTSGVVKTATAGQVAVYEFTRNSAPADATGSLGQWTWTLPAAARRVTIISVSGGGGGASGRRGATSTLSGGGGGGGPGDVKKIDAFVSDFTSTTFWVQVGAGGTGGAAVTANDTNGNIGTSGGASGVRYNNSTGAQIIWHDSTGYRAEAGTNTAGGLGRAGSWVHFGPGQHHTGGNGGDGTTAPTTGTTNQNNAAASPTGGGGGGGINTANTTQAGAAAIAPYRADGTGVIPSGGTAGGGGGGAGIDKYFGYLIPVGSGGAGGGSSTTTAGGIGGNGGFPGGGGGGGGASRNGFNSGAGGNGGDGIVRIVVFF